MNMKEIYASLLAEEQPAVKELVSTEDAIARITPIIEETIKKCFLNLNRPRVKDLISYMKKDSFTAYPYVEIEFTHKITWGIFIGFMFISATGESKIHNIEVHTFNAFSYFGCPSTMLNANSLDGLFADEEKVIYHSPWEENRKKVGFRFIV